MKLSATVKHTTFKACKLTAMKEYIFRISAENQYGIGEPAEHPPIFAKYSFGMFLFLALKNGSFWRLDVGWQNKDSMINHIIFHLFKILLVLQPESLPPKSLRTL